jgi:hypothetical protein
MEDKRKSRSIFLKKAVPVPAVTASPKGSSSSSNEESDDDDDDDSDDDGDDGDDEDDDDVMFPFIINILIKFNGLYFRNRLKITRRLKLVMTTVAEQEPRLRCPS